MPFVVSKTVCQAWWEVFKDNVPWLSHPSCYLHLASSLVSAPHSQSRGCWSSLFFSRFLQEYKGQVQTLRELVVLGRHCSLLLAPEALEESRSDLARHCWRRAFSSG